MMLYCWLITLNLLIMSFFMWMLYIVNNYSMFFQLDLVSFMQVSFSLSMIVDKYSLIFMIMVTMISTIVMIYSIYYMMEEKMKKKFFLSMFFFILSMMILSFSANIFWLMVGWDGLGLSSFILIMYFQNWNSFNSSMTTFMCNRFGDLFMLISIALMVNFLSNFCLSFLNSNLFSFLFCFFIIVCAMTKSAQVPFSVWLPLAMAAPTPVSSLVHSSTLITAGVFLCIRFSSILMEVHFLFILSYISSFTFIMSGLSAMYEYDLKKIIALSTLSHMALIFFFLSMNSFESSMIHLITHAIFKSSLFMSAGVLIHDFCNNQDIRTMKIKTNNMKLIFMIIIPIFSMMGILFLSGFYSKELMGMTMVWYNTKNCYIGLYFIAVVLTCMYSTRLLYILINNKINSNMLYKEENQSIYYILYVSSSISIFLGGFLLKLITSFWKFQKDVILMKLLFWLILFFMFIGMLMGFLIAKKNYKNSFMKNFMKKMWFVSSFTFFYQNYFFKFSMSVMFLDVKGLVDKMIYNWIDLFMKTKMFLMKLMSMKSNYFQLLSMVLMFLQFLVMMI
nr:NADH dehydrogenase subunit 5 [Ibidoecus bisignatus]